MHLFRSSASFPVWRIRSIPGKMRANAHSPPNQRTRRPLPAGVKGEVITLVENGVDLSDLEGRTRARVVSSATTFAYVGRLVGWKAVDLLLEVVAGTGLW